MSCSLKTLSLFPVLILTLASIFSQPVLGQERQESKEEQEFEGNLRERFEWFETRQLAGPEKNIPVARAKGYQQFQQISNQIALSNGMRGALKGSTPAAIPAWVPIGGTQDRTTSGRATCVAFHPTDKNTLFLGTAQGGLWKTTDFGTTWVSLSERWETLRIGAVTLDPSNPNIIYAGTGDPDPASLNEATYKSSTDGIGIYRSTDGGLNWTLWARDSSIESRINQIVIDPTNSNIVYVSGHTGLCKTTDGGQSWKRLILGTSVFNNVGTISFALSPDNPSEIIAAGGGKVFRSINAGVMWDTMSAQLKTPGLPTFSRGTIAISKNYPNVVYLSASNSGGQLAGVCLSTDRGVTWRTMCTSPNYLGKQGWYANAIAVDPTNPAHIFVGGLDVYESKDSGETLSPVSFYWAESNSPQYTHADIHRLVFSDDNIFTLSDGGIYYSKKDLVKWVSSMNAGLSTLQFVGIDADPDFTYAIGGCQDNGMNRADTKASFFSKTGDGDGGNTQVSQVNGLVVYSTYFEANLRKSTNGGKSWIGGGRNMISNDSLLTENTPFYMNFDVHKKNHDLVAICGNNKVWLSTTGATGANSFTSISKNSDIPGGPSAVHLATANEKIIYVSSGKSVSSTHYIYTKIDGNKWRRSQTRVGYVTQILSDPNDAGHAYLVTAGYGVPHFFETKDTGYTWTATAVNLPDVPCNALALAPNGEMFIGNEFGVLRSPDNGVHWYKLDNGIPLVQVLTLQVRANGARLLAGTYGRGAYYLDLTQLPNIPVDAVTQPASVAPNDLITINSLYPNPATGSSKSTLNYTLKQGGIVTVTLYDALGREIRSCLHDYQSAGTQSIALDLAGISSGNYYCAITANGLTVNRTLTVNR